jgi:hypothetical protein
LVAASAGPVPRAGSDWASTLLTSYAATRDRVAKESRVRPLASPRSVTNQPSPPHS